MACIKNLSWTEPQKSQSWYLVLDCDLDWITYIPGHAEKLMDYRLKFPPKHLARKKQVFVTNFTQKERIYTNKGSSKFVNKIQVQKWWFAGITCLPFNIHKISGSANNYDVTYWFFLYFLMQIYYSIHSFISLGYQFSESFH